MENLQRHDIERLIEASAAVIAAQLHASDLLAWSPQNAVVLIPVPPLLRLAGPEPTGSERPMRFFAPVDLPSDGPTTKQQLKHIECQLSAQRRREFADDLKVRSAAPIRPRPKLGCLEVNDLTEDTCRYPRGVETIRFCGRMRKRGAYCARHAAACYGMQK